MNCERRIDARGVLCPQPIIDLAAAIRTLRIGDTVCILCDDLAFPLDLESWCKGTRHELLSLEQDGRVHTGIIRKAHD
jgi:TusA-related sulfurtransferase